MSEASYQARKTKNKHEFEEKEIQNKSILHYNRWDIENELEKRWIYGLCFFFAGLILMYLIK